MSILALFNALLLFVTVFMKKRKAKADGTDIDEARETLEEDEIKENAASRLRLVSLKIIALLAGIVPGILFLILENIRLPIVWITQWTPIIGAFFIIHMILLLAQFMIKKRNSQLKEEDNVEKDGEFEGRSALATEGAAG